MWTKPQDGLQTAVALSAGPVFAAAGRRLASIAGIVFLPLQHPELSHIVPLRIHRRLAAAVWPKDLSCWISVTCSGVADGGIESAAACRLTQPSRSVAHFAIAIRS